MTPIPFPIPTGRALPPTTAYAAGLVCELRPDLADGHVLSLAARIRSLFTQKV